MKPGANSNRTGESHLSLGILSENRNFLEAEKHINAIIRWLLCRPYKLCKWAGGGKQRNYCVSPLIFSQLGSDSLFSGFYWQRINVYQKRFVLWSERLVRENYRTYNLGSFGKATGWRMSPFSFDQVITDNPNLNPRASELLAQNVGDSGCWY